MTFKERLLEENMWEKTKGFVKDNAALTAGLGGAGAGALLNYATDGASDMAEDRTQDLEDFRKEDVTSHIAEKALGSKDDFTDLRDAKRALLGDDRSKLMRPINWALGRSEDLGAFKSDFEYNRDVTNYQRANPNADVGTGVDAGFTLNGHQVNTRGTSDNAWDKYAEDVTANQKTLANNPAAIDNAISGDKSLASQQNDLKKDIGNSTQDSYRNKILGGAALGAGGTYAHRKLKERYPDKANAYG